MYVHTLTYYTTTLCTYIGHWHVYFSHSFEGVGETINQPEKEGQILIICVRSAHRTSPYSTKFKRSFRIVRGQCAINTRSLDVPAIIGHLHTSICKILFMSKFEHI